MSLTLLSANDVKQCITMPEAIDAMENAFLQLANKQVNLPLRTAIAIDREDATSLTMPAYLQHENQLGLKVVSFFPNNLRHHLPSINGVILLLDAQTGEPKALMDAVFLTALRTGAVSGLATRLLAKEDASRVAILGSGAQAMTQIDAVRAVRPIKQVRIWSRTPEHAEALAKQLENQIETQVYSTIPYAVKDADIICTSTSSTSPLVYYSDIKENVHINAIGSHTKDMQEIALDVMENATLIVDQITAATKEAGEIIRVLEAGNIEAKSLIELGQLLLHPQPKLKDQRTVFKSVGLAIQDISIAEMVYKNAVKRQVGCQFDLS